QIPRRGRDAMGRARLRAVNADLRVSEASPRGSCPTGASERALRPHGRASRPDAQEAPDRDDGPLRLETRSEGTSLPTSSEAERTNVGEPGSGQDSARTASR